MNENKLKVPSTERDVPWNKKSVIFRKPSMERSPKGFFSVSRVFVVEFKLSEKECLQLKCVGNQTVSQIKENLLIEIEESYPNYSLDTDIVISYKLNGQVVEICDLSQTFQTLRVAQMWSTTGLKAVLYVSKQKEATNSEKMFNIQLGSLMGMIWGSFQSITDEEFYTTRRKLTNVRRHALAARNVLDYSMELSLDNSQPSQKVLAHLEDNKFTICIYGKDKNKIELFVHKDDSPPTIIRRFMSTICESAKCDFDVEDGTTASDYVLKVCGVRDYLWGQSPIINFEYIRNCLIKKRDPQLCIKFPLSEDDDKCPDFFDPWNLVDESTGMAEDHKELTIRGKDHTKIVAFSIWDMPMYFKIKIVGLDFLSLAEGECEIPQEIFVEASLYHGQFQLAKPVTTDRIVFDGDHKWYTWLQFNIRMRNIPKEARLSVRVIGVYEKPVSVKTGIVESGDSEEHHVVLRWANMQLLNHRSVLRTGKYVFRMWPTPFNDDISFTPETGTTAPNLGSGNTNSVAKLYIQMDTYRHPVAFPRGEWEDPDAKKSAVSIEKEEPVHGSHDWSKLEEILKQDQLHTLDETAKDLLYKYRWYCRRRPNTLPKLLQSVNPASVLSVGQMHRVLQKWPSISMEVAIELLDSHFVDKRVRSLAVSTIKGLSNKRLMPFLLQLTQALKFECYHDSALARFLLTRALQSKRIGHYFYWFLRSEMDNPHMTHRYAILLEAYLRGCGKKMLAELTKQSQALSCFKSIAYQVTSRTKHSKSSDALREELGKAPLPEAFQAPFDPRLTLGKLNPSGCKVMDSKKRPLWLEFQNADETAVTDENKIIRIIFKQGDDLRQDMLTLQMLTVMGQLWEEEGLDLCLLPYGCMSTGMQIGVIQVVQNATTVAKIQRDFGGLIRGSFKDEILKKWLEHNNPHPEVLRQAVKTFMLSCAGYCVATYVLGIGDRHNDNIMVKDNGNLFHIDFGHFLGNTKTFYGIQRERVPFVLTPDFVYAMGGENSEMFQLFKDTAVHAFLVIRRHAALFINLFHMMKSTGIPELTSVRDIHYLKNVLILDKTEVEAKQHFLDEIAGVLKKSWTVQVNWLMHGLIHAGN